MSRATTIREAILECFRAHGGRTLTNREVNQWVKRGYPNRWKDVSTDLADLTIGGNTSSGYRDLEKCLIRVAPGEYCLDQAFLPQELPDGDRVAMSPTMTRVGGTTSSGENEAQSTGPDAGTAFSVVGTPATFATSAETLWREILDATIPNASGEQGYTGVVLTFRVESAQRGCQPFDLDNLCEPVFSVMVNKKGYFVGRRPNIQWWHASRQLAADAGCRIELIHTDSPLERKSLPLFEGTYQGEFPRGARDTRIASWLETLRSPGPDSSQDGYVVSLRFGSSTINLGDIATGSVKSIIDNLYPIVGGAPQKPEDWRIEELHVEKGITTLGRDEVEITIYAR